MPNESRVLLSLFFAVFCLPVAFLAFDLVMTGAPEASASGVRQVFWDLFLLTVVVVPLLPLLLLLHFALRHFQLCYLWLHVAGSATLYATVMAPLLGLYAVLPAGGAVAGFLFYFTGVYPYKGAGAAFTHEIKALWFMLAWVSFFVATVFIFVKLRLVEEHFTAASVLDFVALAIKPALDWNSYQSMVTPEKTLLIYGKHGYIGQFYFAVIVQGGWLVAAALSVLSGILYGLWSRRAGISGDK